jgi:hypothetical protein
MALDAPEAADTFAFYQAKTIRQTSNQLAADSLEALLVAQPDVSDAARGQIQARIDAYRATASKKLAFRVGRRQSGGARVGCVGLRARTLRLMALRTS